MDAHASTDFTPQDFAARLARIRAGDGGVRIDTLIVTDPSNMCWATGYDGWSFYVHQAVIVGPEGAPIWWGRGIDAAGARRTIIGAPTTRSAPTTTATCRTPTSTRWRRWPRCWPKRDGIPARSGSNLTITITPPRRMTLLDDLPQARSSMPPVWSTGSAP
jgi:Xaa-Pro aminopeptidase